MLFIIAAGKAAGGAKPPSFTLPLYACTEPILHPANPNLYSPPEKVMVAAKEDMESHLDVVPLLVLEAGHLSPDPGPRLVDVHLVPLIEELHRRGQPGQAPPHDGHLEAGGALW